MITFIVLILVYRRLYYGVDFTDESFYVALPYRFVLGDKPFIDELSIVQMSSFLTYPFVNFYIWVMGNSDGLMLFMRNVYLWFNIFVASVVFMAIRKILRWREALIISLIVIVFVPFNIPNLNYNTLGMGFLTAGLFSALWVLLNDKNHYHLLFSSLFFVFAIISYPTLILPVITFILSTLLLYPHSRKIIFTILSIGLLLPMLIFIILLFVGYGVGNIMNSINYSSSLGVQGGGFDKIIKISKSLLLDPFHVSLIPVYLTIYWQRNRIGIKYIIFTVMLFLAIPIVYYFYGDNYAEVTVSMRYISFCSFFAPILYLYTKNNEIAKQFFYVVWLPSFIAGIVVAWTSGNGYVSAAIGLLPGSIITFVLLAVLLKERMFIDRINIIRFIPPLLAVAILLFFQYSSVYRDDKISDLRVKIENGPYKELYTSEEKNNYIKNMQDDIDKYLQLNDKILFYDNFPAGYLFNNTRAATNTVWTFPLYQYVGVNRQSTIDYYKKNNIEPDIVVKIIYLYINKEETQNILYLKNDPLNNMIESSKYGEVLSTRDYKIFRKK